MKFKSWLLVGSLVAASFGVAEAAPKALEVTRSANPPVALRATMPRGAKSWFYGKAPAQLGKRAVWLHFYSVPTNRLVPKPNLNSSGDFVVNPSDYVLSLWERSVTGKGKTRKTRYRGLNSIRWSGAEFLNAYNGYLNQRNEQWISISARVMWLRDSTRQTPIVRLSVEVGNGVNASTQTDDVLFVFSGGLQKRPHIQQFSTYFELLESANHSYDKTDESGLLMIEKETRVQAGMDAEIIRTKSEFRWNGSEFIAEIPAASPPAVETPPAPVAASPM